MIRRKHPTMKIDAFGDSWKFPHPIVGDITNWRFNIRKCWDVGDFLVGDIHPNSPNHLDIQLCKSSKLSKTCSKSSTSKHENWVKLIWLGPTMVGDTKIDGHFKYGKCDFCKACLCIWGDHMFGQTHRMHISHKWKPLESLFKTQFHQSQLEMLCHCVYPLQHPHKRSTSKILPT